MTRKDGALQQEYKDLLLNKSWKKKDGKVVEISQLKTRHLQGILHYLKRAFLFMEKDTAEGFRKIIREEIHSRFEDYVMPTEYEGLSDQEKIDKFRKEKGVTKLEPVEELRDEYRHSKMTAYDMRIESLMNGGLRSSDAFSNLNNIRPVDKDKLIGREVMFENEVQTIDDLVFVNTGKVMYETCVLSGGKTIKPYKAKKILIPKKEKYTVWVSSEERKIGTITVETTSAHKAIIEATEEYEFKYMDIDDKISDFDFTIEEEEKKNDGK
jgi:hypothetical protein